MPSIPEHLLLPLEPHQRVFNIQSFGRSGIVWISEALNLDPRIHAACDVRVEHNALYGNVTADECIRISSNLHPKKDIIGNLASVHPEELDILRKHYGHKYYGCYFMAHPILRLAGSIAISRCLNRIWDHAHFVKLWGITAEHPLAQKNLALLGDNGDYVPANYINHLNIIPNYVNTSLLLRFEDLWTSDNAWHEFVLKISGGTITDFGNRWRELEGKILGPYDGAAQRPLHLTPHDAWDSFTHDERFQITCLLTHETRIFHEKLGYDLSFIPHARS